MSGYKVIGVEKKSCCRKNAEEADFLNTNYFEKGTELQNGVGYKIGNQPYLFFNYSKSFKPSI